MALILSHPYIFPLPVVIRVPTVLVGFPPEILYLIWQPSKLYSAKSALIEVFVDGAMTEEVKPIATVEIVIASNAKDTNILVVLCCKVWLSAEFWKAITKNINDTRSNLFILFLA